MASLFHPARLTGAATTTRWEPASESDKHQGEPVGLPLVARGMGQHEIVAEIDGVARPRDEVIHVPGFLERPAAAASQRRKALPGARRAQNDCSLRGILSKPRLAPVLAVGIAKSHL
jgi:hypothetical protein